MTGIVQNLLAELKLNLESLYGERLQGLYLYGSYARSEQQWDSDLDVLIILNQVPSYGAEIDRTSKLFLLCHCSMVSALAGYLSAHKRGESRTIIFSPVFARKPSPLEETKSTAV